MPITTAQLLKLFHAETITHDDTELLVDRLEKKLLDITDTVDNWIWKYDGSCGINIAIEQIIERDE